MYLPDIFADWMQGSYNSYIIPVTSKGGTFPALDDVWFIDDHQMIENRTVDISEHIVVKAGGLLDIKNASLIMNSTLACLLDIIVLTGGEMRLSDANITSFNKTAEARLTKNWWQLEPFGIRYDMYLFGKLTMMDSSIEFFDHVMVYSDDAELVNANIFESYFGRNDVGLNIMGAGFDCDQCYIESNALLMGSWASFENTIFPGTNFEIHEGVTLIRSSDFVHRPDRREIEFHVGNGDLIIEDVNATEDTDIHFSDDYSSLQSGLLQISNSTFAVISLKIHFGSGRKFIFHNNVVIESKTVRIDIGNDWDRSTRASITSNTFQIDGDRPFIEGGNADIVFENNELDLIGNDDPKAIVMNNEIQVHYYLFSEFPIPVRPSIDVKSMNGKGRTETWSSDPREDCKVPISDEKEKSYRWCMDASARMDIERIQADGKIVDPNPYEFALGIRLWRGDTTFRARVSEVPVYFFVHITKGTSFYLSIILLPFMASLALIVLSVDRPVTKKGVYGPVEEELEDDEDNWLIGKGKGPPLPKELEKEEDVKRW
jgi:hypothetical protein